MAEITLSPEQVDTAQAGTMKRPFDIPQAMDDLYDANALASVSKTLHERGDDAWRVLGVLYDHLLTSINQLDKLESGRCGAMNPPFSILQAVDDLHNANALAVAARSMHECGDDAWRVLDVLSDRLLTVTNQLDALESVQRETERSLEGGSK
jgi:hypothetical protein